MLGSVPPTPSSLFIETGSSVFLFALYHNDLFNICMLSEKNQNNIRDNFNIKETKIKK